MKNQSENCRFCEILRQPRKYVDWIFKETDDYIICHFSSEHRKIYCIYKKHMEACPGHITNEMVTDMIKMGGHVDDIVYYNHGHYYITIDVKGEK